MRRGTSLRAMPISKENAVCPSTRCEEDQANFPVHPDAGAARRRNLPPPSNPYEWLWRRIGGRPWTYILRDAWHRYEGIWILALIACGALLGRFFWSHALWVLLAFTLGYIAGHLFWGTPYVPDQRPDSEDGESPSPIQRGPDAPFPSSGRGETLRVPVARVRLGCGRFVHPCRRWGRGAAGALNELRGAWGDKQRSGNSCAWVEGGNPSPGGPGA